MDAWGHCLKEEVIQNAQKLADKLNGFGEEEGEGEGESTKDGILIFFFFLGKILSQKLFHSFINIFLLMTKVRGGEGKGGRGRGVEDGKSQSSPYQQ